MLRFYARAPCSLCDPVGFKSPNKYGITTGYISHKYVNISFIDNAIKVMVLVGSAKEPFYPITRHVAYNEKLL